MNNAQQGNAAAGAQQEDYVDKGKLSTVPESQPVQWVSDKPSIGVDALEKKFGGGKLDPGKQRETNEKVTDKGREFLEKKGIHIPKAVSHKLRYRPELLEESRILIALQFSN